MRISQELVDKTTAAAANLQTVVDDTVKRLEDVPASSRRLGPYPTTVYSLLIGFVGAQSPRAAIVLLVVSICTYSIVYA